MKKKTVFYSEAAYLVGIVILALGGALMEKSNFGLSMVIAPAYLIHLKVSEFLPFFSFGMSGYLFQGLLLIVLSVAMGKFKKHYLFSFVTAVLYGLVLDGFVALLALCPFAAIGWRLGYYVSGMLCCSFGVAMLFHTYLPPEAYEVVVKEVAQKFSWSIAKVKTAYDCCSCALGVVLSFAFFGFGTFRGVALGTVVCALLNGWIIGRFGRLQEHFFQFKDALPWRKNFT